MNKENKILRIGIDGRVLQDPKPSGIPQYAANVIKEILKLDQKNRYVLFYNSFRKIEQNLPKFEGNLEVRVYHWPNKFLEWFWKIIPYPKIDKVLRVDAFFSPHFINIPLSKEVKKAVTIHDLSFIKDKRYFSWRKNLWHWQMNPKVACKNFDKIIAVSEATKKDISNLYKINKNKVEVVYNGERKMIDFFEEEKSTAILNKFKIAKKRYLLFLATLEPRKNVEGIIDAYAMINNQIPDLKLVIAGKKGWLFKNIFKKVKKYNLEQKIIFTDFVNEEEKYILFKNAHSFLFPSFCEGFGIPILEAKNHSVPIITSSTSSMPEIIKDAAILVNPHNINDLAQAILKISKSGLLRSILKDKASQIPQNSWRDCAIKTLDILLS
ncbi:MAG: glycosyltransferase family 1 protein [Patescibacteria group bacterium]|nr:glycosyltransferase family 1 protein [Patescibacteria group bacterium]